MLLTELKTAVLDFLFPIHCAECGKEKSHCCEECFAKIPRLANCSLIAPPESHFLDAVIAASPLKEKSALADLIHRMKYDGAEEIAQTLIELFSAASPRGEREQGEESGSAGSETKRALSFMENSANAILIPVPLHPRRLRFRGFNQSALLARRLSARWSIPMEELLIRSRFTHPQVELKKERRLTNVRGAFALKPRISLSDSVDYWLVDDVCTTGSTLDACAEVLKKHGAKKVVGVVVGRAV